MLILIYLLAGCAHSPLVVPRGWKALSYPSPEAEALLLDLWHVHQAASKGWQRPDPVRSGALFEQWWCSPEVDEVACRTGAVAAGETRGTAWRGLSAVINERGGVEWITVDAGRVLADEASGLLLTLRVDAADLELKHWDITALRFAGETPTARVPLGPVLYTSLEQSSFSTPGPALAELLTSPESFAQVAGDAYAGLKSEILGAIAAHEVERCAYGRYYGDGRPRCDKVPLSAHEEASAAEQVRIEQDHHVMLMRSDAEALHALLVEMFPSGLL